MYKLKNSYVDRMIENKTSKAEIAFLLYISRMQDTSGIVHSVYYKDVCKAISCSTQKFYDILVSLSKKGLISYEKIYNVDISVRLLGNDFSDENFSDGYINVAKKDFGSDRFKGMLAGSQLLYLYTQRFVEGKHMLVQNFYDEFCRLFHVAKKTMQIYLQELKDRALLFINKKRNRAYRYEMMMKRSSCLDIKDLTKIPREKEGYLNNIQDHVQRNFGRFLQDGDQGKIALQDIANLADTQRAEKNDNFVRRIVDAIKESINIQKCEKRKQITLNAALVNRCLTGRIKANPAI